MTTTALTTRPTRFGRALQWDVTVDGTIIGTVTGAHFALYHAEVDGYRIDDEYPTLDLAVAAIEITHQRAAYL